MEYCTRPFEESLIEIRDVEEVIIDKGEGSIFKYNTIDSLVAVKKNIFYSLYHVRITLRS